jgi:hypothetical protein
MYSLLVSFAKKTIWWGSCFFFMYLAPMGIEIMFEQNKIIQKIQSDMAISGSMEPGNVEIRPY